MPREIDRLLAIMTRLRDPARGCPWDREQTRETIAPHTIEEAYEVAEAIATGDADAIRDEVGDLLFQVVFYAELAREQGLYDFDGIAGTIADKMVRRHPHVFADETVASQSQQLARWEDGKAQERQAKAGQETSALDGVALALPALTRAIKLQKRAARVGFDWVDAEDILDKIVEEIGELRTELAQPDARARVADEFGDVLFALVNLGRRLGIDAEASLRGTNAKFERRFHSIEGALATQGRRPEDATLDEMENLWQKAKEGEPRHDG